MTSTAASDNNNNNSSADPMEEKILWSSISRNGTILAEAGGDPFEGAVSQTAHGILGKKATPGWEYFTLKNGDGWFGRKQQQQSPEAATTARVPRLKGVKFHIYENNGGGGSWDEAADSDSVIWVFAAVYNPEATTWPENHGKHMLSDVQSFLEKIVGLTEMPRSVEPEWRTGGTLSCQATFAPILLQRMQEVTYLGTMARLSQNVENATELMQSNITAILEREDQLRELDQKGTNLQEMASVFKKNTSSVRRRMMMQNAKHGLILGTAVTVGVAIVVVPPLVAIL